MEFMRRLFALGSLITILLTGVLGICQMSRTNEIGLLSMAHVSAENPCHGQSDACPFSFEEQLIFLSHVTVSIVFPFLVLIVFVVIYVRFVLRSLDHVYDFGLWRSRDRFHFLFQTSFGLTPLAFAFSQGICHPKRA